MKLFFKRAIFIVLFIMIGTGGWLAYDHWIKKEPFPDGLIQANGRIEGDHLTVAGKFPGRVQELLAREGDLVKQGQILVRLDDTQTRAKVSQAGYALAVLDAQVRAAEIALAAVKKEVPLVIEAADAALVDASATLVSTEAAEEQAHHDEIRYKNLATKKIVAKHTLEEADLAWTVARSNLKSAGAGRIQAEKQLREAELGWDRIQVKAAELRALKAQREQARAALVEVQSILADLTIPAPAQGILMTRLVDVGEMVASGGPLFDLVDMDRLYLKAYVPEILIGKLRLGLPARIYTDAFPDRGFPATLRYISSRAEFTPKEVQTTDERVKLVYAVKLYLTANPDHCLTPGMPADAVIRWKEATPWVKPRW